MVIAGRRSKEEDEEEREEQRKKSVRRYAVSEAGVSVILIILSILGFCKWDLPVALASIVVTAGAAVISHKHKFSEKSEETEA